MVTLPGISGDIKRDIDMCFAPSPQGFLLAAQKLGVAPEHCVVIEDAVAGIAAGKQAGMRCIAVTNTHPGEKLAAADLVVDMLEAVSINDLERLIKYGKAD